MESIVTVIAKINEILNSRGKVYEKEGEMGAAVHGRILAELFPKGIDFTKVDSHQFILLNYLLGKVIRYALFLEEGGHIDSAIDAAGYSVLLATITEKEVDDIL